eukprot:CAMPEP_0174313040 /NCGR_PEP_ID=MMETSP0810-20121108/4709_1 /TAXON_ID=73025 ORGANISM="Eutreptiella gymnastica-like, Strain CCMP1594" /NCGR_SAMPLE_ID=MMETSP0810 /ASSEMBLY_ACC=CAM_ASM_000659 /LENGTH=51 /DNA_ID=CAMNT_0015421669 /DNA_START=635 /DNA_END=790 /DNA_ORIENTATION=+
MLADSDVIYGCVASNAPIQGDIGEEVPIWSATKTWASDCAVPLSWAIKCGI